VIVKRYYLAYRLLKDNITEKNGVNEFKVRDVIQNTYTQLFHMQACQPITAEAGLHTADTPLQTERSKQRLKSG